MYKISHRFAKLSPLHNKYPIADYTLVDREISELVAEGRANTMMRKAKKKAD